MFKRIIAPLRPRLHRYCARMTGSVIDGEDVVQDALLKALEAFPQSGPLTNPEAWLFRIAHNAALDHLRRRARHEATHADEDLDMIAAPADVVHDRQVTAASLRTFMRLPVAQRSAVILRDVLGYSVEEVCEVMGGSIPAIKGALQRGRLRLRELAQEPDDSPPPALAEPERARLVAYVERFNSRDFDSVRDMLAEDVRLDLVTRWQVTGTVFPESRTAGRRSSCSIRTIPRDRRRISSCWSGRTSTLPGFEISTSPAMPWKKRKSLRWADNAGRTSRVFSSPACRFARLAASTSIWFAFGPEQGVRDFDCMIAGASLPNTSCRS